MTAERRDLDVADLFHVRRAGLGELPSHATDLHGGRADGVGQDDRHLEDDAELLADVVGGELFEALGAVTGLEEERIAGGDLAEVCLERPGLLGEDQRGHLRDGLQRPFECAGVGPVRLLPCDSFLPGTGRPLLTRRHVHKASEAHCAGREMIRVRPDRRFARAYACPHACRSTPARCVEALARFVPLDQPVLDVGCGTGLSGAALAAGGFVDVSGQDVNQAMLDVARRARRVSRPASRRSRQVAGDYGPHFDELGSESMVYVLRRT